jgi:predicted CxxxxCH...CXXCH cytochrome family protein
VPADQAHAVGAEHAPVALVATGSMLGNLLASGQTADLGSYSVATGTCTSYCHGSGLVDGGGVTPPAPAWSGGAVSCGVSCHGAPPDTGRVVYGQTLHAYHYFEQGYDCTLCHATSLDSSWNAMAKHLNGAKDVSFLTGGSWDGVKTCTTACHGGAMTWR